MRGAQLVIVIVGRMGFDAGRCAQNMLLAAWNEGVVSCPNGIKEPEEAAAALGLEEGAEIGVVLSFGYPVGSHDPGRRSVDEWSARADRRPLTELVTRL